VPLLASQARADAWAEGRAMNLDQIAAYVLADSHGPPAVSAGVTPARPEQAISGAGAAKRS
jgi:hypothetical protein